MDDGPSWRPDPAHAGQERYWSGSEWTDRVRPAGRVGSLHLAEHVPELQRALAAATADIDSVEDRLSALFERGNVPPGTATAPGTGLTPAPGLSGEGFADQSDEDDDTFAELDAALVSEQSEESEQSETARRGLFRRRS